MVSRRETEIAIARCGIACEVCQHFNRECLGCEKENNLKNKCLIFNCAKEKDIQYCTQCREFPCKLMVGLSKAYCPIFTEIKLKVKALSDIKMTVQKDTTPRHLLEISN